MALKWLTLRARTERDKERALKTKEWTPTLSPSQTPLNLPGAFLGTRGPEDLGRRSVSGGGGTRAHAEPAPGGAPSLLERQGGKSETLPVSQGQEEAAWRAWGKRSFPHPCIVFLAPPAGKGSLSKMTLHDF